MLRAFEFKGRDGGGLPVRGVIEAEDDSRARSRLRERGLFVTSLAAQRPRLLRSWVSSGVELEAVEDFTFHLTGLTEAGVPLLRGLEVLREQTEHPRMRAVISDLEDAIQSGHSLSGAMARHPAIFSPLYLGIVRSGEVAGSLDQALRRLNDYLEREVALNQKVRSMLVYPAIVVTLSVVVVGLFVVFVVPAFERVYRSAGATLPLPTQILVQISHLVRRFWLPGAIVTGVAIWGAGRARVWQVVRQTAAGLLRRIPRVGAVARFVQVSRFVRTFGAMYTSGVPVLVALNVTTEALSDPSLHEAVGHLRDGVNRGRRLSEVMRSLSLFPPLVPRMVALGEESGRLDTMLQRAADLLDRDVDHAIKRLVTLAEPALTLVLGALVAGVLLALYLPIFGLARTLTR
jgi:type IV pilus assembly protein PilC